MNLLHVILAFLIGLCCGLSLYLFWSSGSAKQPPRGATIDRDQMLHGKHKMHWFYSRAYEEDENLQSMPLREYAAYKTANKEDDML